MLNVPEWVRQTAVSHIYRFFVERKNRQNETHYHLCTYRIWWLENGEYRYNV